MLALFFWPLFLWAQMDPSSAILLRQGSVVSDDVELDSGRYRFKAEERREDRRETAKGGRQPTTKKSAEVVSAEAAETKEPKEPQEPQVVVPARAEELAPAEGAPKPGVQDYVLGGTPEEIENYRVKLHLDDQRRNILELAVAPSYFYLGSSSNYSYRDFAASAPAVELGAKIWLTPFFGLVTNYLNSMDGTVGSGPTDSNRVSFELQSFDAGLRWRKFFGVSRRAPSLSVGADYSEIQNKFSSTASGRVNTKSTGVRLAIEAQLPRSNSFGLGFGAFLAPKFDNQETASTGSIRSGGKASSSLVGFWLGGQSHFDRHHQIFWRLQHSIERNFFQGAASTSDPLTGATPDGVTVTNGLSLIVLGYRWGS